MELKTVEQWREQILHTWEKYGTGKPLEPRVVDRVAEMCAKPIVFPTVPVPYWHGKNPFVEFKTVPWPWVCYGMSFCVTPPRPTDRYSWIDGSCLVTALVKEGPKSIVKWEPRQ